MLGLGKTSAWNPLGTQGEVGHSFGLHPERLVSGLTEIPQRRAASLEWSSETSR